MPKILSSNFGAVEYQPGEPFDFPQGLPGFPDETALLPVELPDQFPLLYLQSLRTPNLCFIALPVLCIDPDFQLAASAEDLSGIDLHPDVLPGPELLCMALVCFGDDGRPVANLRAPLLINVRNRKGIQAVQTDERYPIRYPLQVEEEVGMCS